MKINKVLKTLFVSIAVISIALAAFLIYAAKDNITLNTLKNRNHLYLSARYFVLTHLFRNKKPIYHLDELPAFKFDFSQEDSLFISTIFQLVRQHKFDCEKYKQLNKWRTGKLSYKNETFDIKWKAHGREPTGHFKWGNISLNVKLLNKKKLFNTKHFRLIVYRRLNDTSHGVGFNLDFLTYVAENFNVYLREHFVVKISSKNQKHEQLYYFEKRLDTKYVSLNFKNSFLLGGDKNNKSGLFFGKESQDNLNEIITSNLNKSKITNQQKQKIISHYETFNNYIRAAAKDSIVRYIDIDYISSYLAARMLMGCNMHGLNKNNFYVVFDTISNKFYPLLSRDEIFRVLKSDSIEHRMHYYFNETRLGKSTSLNILLLQNDLLRHKTYAKVLSFIKNKGVNYLFDIEAIINTNEQRYFPEWIKSVDGLTHLALKPFFNVNAASIVKYLTPNPVMKVVQKAKENYLVFYPKSVSSLQVLDLRVQTNVKNHKFFITYYDNKRKLKVNNIVCETDKNGIINLTTFFKNQSYFDWLDTNLNRVGQKIEVKLKSTNGKKIKINEKLSYTIYNSITEDTIFSDKTND